jgi:Polyketide cyclase / dehydrase and lipid transport
MPGRGEGRSGAWQTDVVRPLRVVAGSRIVPAPAGEIFDLLASPARHPEFDGSGTVREVRGRRTPERLYLGATFGMQMRWGAPYAILNEVVEFDEDRQIGWRHFAGHIWRYRLESLGPGSTRVTEEFDPRPSRWPRATRLLGWERRNQLAIEQTLANLVEWAANR